MNDITIYQSLETADTTGVVAATMELVKLGGKIEGPVSEEDRPKALEVLARIRTAKKRIEDLRVEAKRPILEIQRKIDGEAKEYQESLNSVDKMIEAALLAGVDLEEDKGKNLPAKSKEIGSLGSSGTTVSEYRFEVDKSLKWITFVEDKDGNRKQVPETCLVDVEKRVQKATLRKYINEAKKKGRIPNNVPGFVILREDKIVTRTAATLKV